jgi:hypothetical protein
MILPHLDTSPLLLQRVRGVPLSLQSGDQSLPRKLAIRLPRIGGAGLREPGPARNAAYLMVTVTVLARSSVP